jgi:Fur family ferric uptake transcriptional regulator
VTDPSLPEALRARGLRMTAPRQLVLEAVRRLGHATPEQIHGEVRQTAAGVNVTTVYRTLELLEELGLVTHTHLSHGAPTYHTADDKHVHLVCRLCGEVAEAPTDLLSPLAHELRQGRGFSVDIGHVALFGLCARCSGDDEEPHATHRRPAHPAPGAAHPTHPADRRPRPGDQTEAVP